MKDKDDSRPWKIPMPKNLRRYILTECQPEAYLFFNNRTGKCFCTRCEKQMDIPAGTAYTHTSIQRWTNTYRDVLSAVHCPNCSRLVFPKDQRYGRKKLRTAGRILWSRAYGRTTIFELGEFSIDYTDITPHVGYFPASQVKINKDTQLRYDNDWYWNGGYAWNRVETIRTKSPNYSMAGIPSVETYIYDALEKGTDLRYAGDLCSYEDDPIAYAGAFLRWPSIEILEKAGFEDIARQRILGGTCRHINWRASDLRKILKMDMSEVRELRKLNPTIHTVNEYWRIKKLYPALSMRSLSKAITVASRYFDPRGSAITKYMTIEKAIEYLLHQQGNNSLQDYDDYLTWVDAIGLRADKRTLYPLIFREAHDSLMTTFNDYKLKANAEAFRLSELAITSMSEPYIGSKKTLLIRPAADPEELVKESQALGHCVRTYIDKVVKGTTSILFIRKIAEPDKPYYTLELNSSGKVVQCRGEHNRSCTDEVNELVKEWHEWWSSQKKKREKAAHKAAATKGGQMICQTA